MQHLGLNTAEASRVFVPASRDRRRSVRQKVHTPSYASLNGASSRRGLSLNEIVNISESGMAIQASWPLEATRRVELCLDLSETKSIIYTAGQVIWSDRSGRVGIHFTELSPSQLSQLKEWLFVNAIVGCANYVAEREFQFGAAPSLSEPAPNLAANPSALRLEVPPPARSDYTAILTALAAVKKEVEFLSTDLPSALQLVASRAYAFTGASGAAIALCEGADMVCRAGAGPDAPAPGARFKIGSGFSGECVRTGQLLRCEDSEIDPLVDRDACRALGIRSMIAVPVRWGEAVIGLLEIFAPEPHAFIGNDDVVLRRLADIAATAVYRAGSPETPAAPKPAPVVDDEFPVETPADIVLPHLSMSRRMLFVAVAATLIFVAYWLTGPWDFSGLRSSRHSSAQPPSKAALQAPSTASASSTTLDGLRTLAEHGDAAAQFAVGARYATGEEVSQDYAEAVRWFSKAAEQGHVVAQATLGAYYWAGRGVPSDLMKAYFWSVLAQAGGDEASKYRVAVLASRMSRDQILAVQQQADVWIKEHQTAKSASAAAH
jgi:putative methionine-R-sulfoxide reductase with GAF domain